MHVIHSGLHDPHIGLDVGRVGHYLAGFAPENGAKEDHQGKGGGYTKSAACHGTPLADQCFPCPLDHRSIPFECDHRIGTVYQAQRNQGAQDREYEARGNGLSEHERLEQTDQVKGRRGVDQRGEA